MVVAAVAVLVAMAAVGVTWHRSANGVLVTRSRREVLVTLAPGETFRGVLFESDGDAIVLRNAVGVGFGTDGALAPVQGELLLLRSTVAYMQAI